MVKELIWTEIAKISRKEILEYWQKRNHSLKYSTKLNKIFSESANQIQRFPFFGIKISNQFYRGLSIKDYYLIYKIQENTIEIHLIWDTRQRPEKLLEIMKKFEK